MSSPGRPRVRAWVEGVLEQARRPEAADNTRPFAINGLRIADRFPGRVVAAPATRCSRRCATAIDEAGGDPEHDARAVYHLAFGTMQDALVRHARPTDADVEHVVQAALAS